MHGLFTQLDGVSVAAESERDEEEEDEPADQFIDNEGEPEEDPEAPWVPELAAEEGDSNSDSDEEPTQMALGLSGLHRKTGHYAKLMKSIRKNRLKAKADPAKTQADSVAVHCLQEYQRVCVLSFSASHSVHSRVTLTTAQQPGQAVQLGSHV